MPIEITMPKLTDTMTEATLAKWLKREGDKVNPGDMIAEVETDKATQELKCLKVTVAKIVVGEGGKMAVGALIAVLAKAGEDVKAVAANVKVSAAPAKAPAAAPVKEGGSGGDARLRRRLRKIVPIPAVEVPVVVEDHEEGSEPEVLNSGNVRVSPLARKIANEKGVDVSGIRGTGQEGRIIKRDVIDAASRPKAAKSGGDCAGMFPAVSCKSVKLRGEDDSVEQQCADDRAAAGAVEAVDSAFLSVD